MTLSKAGMDPGTLVYIGEPKTERVQIDLIHYSAEQVQETSDIALKDIPTSLKPQGVNWICISGVHDGDIIRELGAQFNIHPLVLEDIMNTTGRPKFELENNCAFICGKMMEPKEKRGVKAEQFSILLCGNTLLFFQQDAGDTFDQLRERISTNIQSLSV